MKRITTFLVSAHAFLLPVLVFLGGLTLVILSLITGVARLDFKGSEVGFLAAPNWSINYLLPLPAIVLIGLILMRCMQVIHPALIRRRMLFDNESRAIVTDPAMSLATWMSVWKVGLVIGLACGLIGGIAYTAWDCYTHGIRPQLQGSIGELSPDWSIAPLIDSSVDRSASIAFNVSAYALQACVLAFAFVYLATIVMVGAFMVVLGSDMFGTCHLVPDVRNTDDPRLGFDEFEVIGSLILVTGFITFLAMYFTILQNHYLDAVKAQGPSVPGSILDVIASAAEAASESGSKSSALPKILKPQLPKAETAQAALLLALSVLLVAFAVVPSIAFTFAASQARRRLASLAMDSQFPFEATFGVSPEEAIKRLKAMKIWPYGYFAVNLVIASLVLAIGGLVWPLLAPYLYCVLVVIIIGYVIKRFHGAFPTTPQSPAKA